MVLIAIASWLTPSCLFVFLNLTIGAIAVASAFSAGKTHHRRHPYQIIRDVHASPSLLDRVRSFHFSRHRSDHSFPADLIATPSDSSLFSPDLHSSPPLLLRATSFIRSLDFSPHKSHPPASSDGLSPPSPLAGISPDSKTLEMEEPEAPHTPPYSFLNRVKSFRFSPHGYDPSSPPAETVRASPPAAPSPSFLERMKSMDFSLRWSEIRAVQVTAEGEGEKVGKKDGESEEIKEDTLEKEDDEETSKEQGGKELQEEVGWSGDEGVDKKADDFINRFRQELLLQRRESLLRSN